MLIKLKIQDRNRTINNFHYGHNNLLDYLNKFRGSLNQDLWWTFEIEAENLKIGNKLLLLTDDFNEIISHINEKKIPATFSKDDFYNLYLNSFLSKEHAEVTVKNVM